MGILRVRPMTERPLTWSSCSWVMRMAVRFLGSSPMAWSRAKVSLRLRPASMSRRVWLPPMKVELPAEEEARMQTLTMARDPETLV
jgi:hypothetical protein